MVAMALGQVTAGVGLGQCCAWRRTSPSPTTGSSQHFAAGPHFPQVLGRGRGVQAAAGGTN